MGDEQGKRGLSRRTVLKAGGAVAAAAVGGAAGAGYIAWRNRTYLFLMHEAPKESPHPDPSWQGSTVRSYRPLGNTGIMMSDKTRSGLRDSALSSPDLPSRALATLYSPARLSTINRFISALSSTTSTNGADESAPSTSLAP